VIRIELTDDDLGRTRLALSPLWELVASLFWLHKDEPSPEYVWHCMQPEPAKMSAPSCASSGRLFSSCHLTQNVSPSPARNSLTVAPL